jgi:hypothetical protein
VSRRVFQQIARALGAVSILGVFGPVFLRVVGSAVGMEKPEWWRAFVDMSFGTMGIALVLALVVSAIGRTRPEDPLPRPGIERVDIGVGNPLRGVALAIAAFASFVSLGFIVGVVGKGAVPLPLAITWLFGTMVAYIAAFFAATSPRIVVGRDGFSVISPFATRFISFEGVRSIASSTNTITVHYDAGAPAEIRLARIPVADRMKRIETICEAIRDAGRLYATGASPAAAALLERRGRGPREWREALANVIADRGSYRDATMTADEALQIVERPGAAPEHRVAAAVALSSLPEAREKIRVAASTCANERLRIALEKASEGELDDEALSCGACSAAVVICCTRSTPGKTRPPIRIARSGNIHHASTAATIAHSTAFAITTSRLNATSR